MGQTKITSPSEEPNENAEGVEDMFFARPQTFTAVANQSRAGFSSDLQTQVQLLSQMRKSHLYAVDVPREQELGLIWRLMTATAIAVAVMAVGILLTAVAFIGGSLSPNPYVALAFLLSGSVLLATVVSAVRGGRDDVR